MFARRELRSAAIPRLPAPGLPLLQMPTRAARRPLLGSCNTERERDMRNSTMITVVHDGDGGQVARCPVGSVVILRVRTLEECREAGIDLFPLEWMWSITFPDGTEHLIPAAGTVVSGPPADRPAARVQAAAL